jgi:hypothetical protein
VDEPRPENQELQAGKITVFAVACSNDGDQKFMLKNGFNSTDLYI